MEKFDENSIERNLNLAYDFLEAGDTAQASYLFKTLLESHPKNPLVLFGCGAVSMVEKKFSIAEGHLQDAVILAPKSAIFHETLGKCLIAQDKLDAAEITLKLALTLSPELFESHANLAHIFRKKGKLNDALDELSRAIRLRSDNLELRVNMGGLLWDVGRIEDALLQFEKARTLSKNGEDELFILIERNQLIARAYAVDKLLTCLPNPLKTSSKAPMIAACKLPVIAQGADDVDQRWLAYEKAIFSLDGKRSSFQISDLPKGNCNFYAAYQNRNVKQTQKLIADYYRTACPSLEYSAKPARHNRINCTNGRIKIAFVSAYLKNHTIGKLYGRLIEALDHQRFEITIFSTYPACDEISTVLRKHADAFYILPADLSKKRQMIEETTQDIIFYPDIGMTTETYFLAFSRLAPVQCAGLGHPVTTGIPAIDYFISGIEIEPNGAKEHYTEKLVLLPTLPFTVWPVNKEVELPEINLEFAKGKTLYTCVQSLFKVHPDFDQILLEILEKDQNSVVAFIAGMYGWEKALRSRWAHSIPSVANKIHFIRRLDQTEFLSLIYQSDILLDTIHFSGGNTTAETLGMGKVVVTWPGQTAAGRVSAAYYQNLGITDAIVETLEDYATLAVLLANDRERRIELEQRITKAASTLFDHSDIGAAYGDFFEHSLTLV